MIIIIVIIKRVGRRAGVRVSAVCSWNVSGLSAAAPCAPLVLCCYRRRCNVDQSPVNRAGSNYFSFFHRLYSPQFFPCACVCVCVCACMCVYVFQLFSTGILVCQRLQSRASRLIQNQMRLWQTVYLRHFSTTKSRNGKFDNLNFATVKRCMSACVYVCMRVRVRMCELEMGEGCVCVSFCVL